MNWRRLFLTALIPLLAPISGAGEVTRTLRVELPAAGLSKFAVENLAGAMRVTAGSGDGLVVVATVHAEDAALADGVRLEKLEGAGETQTVHVRYPLAEHSRIRYPDPRDHGWYWEPGFADGTRLDYDGYSVKVCRQHGPVLYADVDVEIPRQVAGAKFENFVGVLRADGLAGKFEFRVHSADLDLGHLDGDILVTGTSGDVRASDIRGSWESRFTSGDSRVRNFHTSNASFSCTSGDVKGENLAAEHLELSATSGDIRIVDADVVDCEASANSGDILLDNSGSRVARIRARATSGDVVLRLPRKASFEAETRHGSGSVRVEYRDLIQTLHERHAATYRRGDGTVRIDVQTGSGDITIEPVNGPSESAER
jgi:hypothetical protein